MDTSSPKFLDKKWNLHWEVLCKKVSLNQLYYAASPTSADEWLVSHYPFVCRILEKLPPKSRVVDAGCGLGEWVFLFQRKGFQAFGIDIAQKTILKLNEFVKKKKISNINFLLGDLRNLSLKDNFCNKFFLEIIILDISTFQLSNGVRDSPPHLFGGRNLYLIS